jgi:hypothetical protein
MSIAELIKTAQFVVDSKGNRKAVQLDLAIWEELITLLEDLEDAEEMGQARQEEDELIPWGQVVSDYKTSHPETDV